MSQKWKHLKNATRGQSPTLDFIFIKSIRTCKRRAFSYINNVFSKEGLFSDDKLSLTEPKMESFKKLLTLYSSNLLENVKEEHFLISIMYFQKKDWFLRIKYRQQSPIWFGFWG